MGYVHMQKVHLTSTEAALIGWIVAFLVDMPDFETDDPRHPVMILAQLHSREALHSAAVAIEANFNGPGFCSIVGPVDEVTADVLRICVENNDYAISLKRQGVDHLAEEAEIALRSLAYKLDELAVPVDHIPSLQDDHIFWSGAR
jgi:hypothetical protein